MKLHYHLKNNGDGSASAVFHQTRAEAEKADEELDEGWGECCAGSVELKMIDEVLHFKTYKEFDTAPYYRDVWLPITD